MRLSDHFTLAELCVTDEPYDNTPGEFEISQLQLLVGDILEPLRLAVAVPVNVSSGYRSARVNSAVGGSKTSQHRKGQAGDIVVAGMPSRHVCRKIIELGLPFDQLIQEYGRWTHVSRGPLNRRQVLTAVRGKDGKTRYLSGLV